MSKRSCALLLAAASGGPFSAASAQTSVTLFGSIDLNLTYSKVKGASSIAMDQGGYLLPSRFGFRGAQDLGGGLSSSFWLEAAMSPDTGATTGSFARRSTVSLASKDFGEVRLGRDYTPTFWNVSSFSPFGTVGVGGSSNILEGWPLGLGQARTQQRASNAVGYFLPPGLGGFYGQLMVAAGEGVDGARYTGGRFGYESGPLNVAIALGRTPIDGTSGETLRERSQRNYTVANLGGTYDFDVFKLYVNLYRQRLGGDRQNNVLIGVGVPLWGGTAKATVARSSRTGAQETTLASDNVARQIAIGYVYSLSKRTTLYGAWSRISNAGSAAYVTGDTAPDGVPGQAASGLQIGINHAF